VSDYTEMLVAYDDEPDHAFSSLAPSKLQPELSAAEAELDRAREDPDDEALPRSAEPRHGSPRRGGPSQDPSAPSLPTQPVTPTTPLPSAPKSSPRNFAGWPRMRTSCSVTRPSAESLQGLKRAEHPQARPGASWRTRVDGLRPLSPRSSGGVPGPTSRPTPRCGVDSAPSATSVPNAAARRCGAGWRRGGGMELGLAARPHSRRPVLKV
jgi:hypothetical protein